MEGSGQAGARGCLFCLSKARGEPGGDSAESAELRAELEAQKLSALKKRARTAGASEQELKTAYDADDSKAALVALNLSTGR